MKAQILHDVDPAKYHADDLGVDRPTLSASIAHVLETCSPLHAHAKHPRLGGLVREPKDWHDHGSLSHRLLLGRGAEVEVVEAPDWRTKAAREARDAAREAGKIPVLEADYLAAEATSEELRARFADRGVELDGESEVVALWEEPSDQGGPVACRGMLDHLKAGGGKAVIYDLKSCRSAHPDACRRSADSYGYAIQEAAYRSALELAMPHMTGRVDFVFVFYELEPPYAVTPVRLAGAFRELGERRWRRAVGTWARCLREGRWPGYADDGVVSLEPPPWALNRDLEKNAAAGEAALMGDG